MKNSILFSCLGKESCKFSRKFCITKCLAENRSISDSCWIARSSIGYLGPGQAKAFELSRDYEEFRILHEMAMNPGQYSVEYWTDLISSAVAHDNKHVAWNREHRGGTRDAWSRTAAAGGQGSEEESENERSPRKKTKLASIDSRSSTIPPHPLRPGIDDYIKNTAPMTTPTTQRSSSVPPEANTVAAKVEIGDDGLPMQFVSLYVGIQNKEYNVTVASISQSPILMSLVIQRPGKMPFIMDPELKNVDVADFDAILQFFDIGEFEPLFVHGRDDTQVREGGGFLEGIETFKQDMEQIARLGRLYVLAKKLQIPEMEGLVFKKLIAGFPRGWEARTMLALVRQVFADIPGTVDNAAIVLSPEPDTQKDDALKGWLIDWLAANVEHITTTDKKKDGDLVAVQYWDTLNNTIGLRLAVCRAEFRQIEKYKGRPVKIEDDEGVDVGGEDHE